MVASVGAVMSLMTLVVAGCGESMHCEGHAAIERSLAIAVGDATQKNLELAKVTDFAWGRLDAFAEYDSVERVNVRTGLDYRPEWWQDVHVPESRTLLVFSNDDGPVCYVETKNEKAPGAAWYFGPSVFQERGIPAAKARFTINREGTLAVLELADQASEP